MVEVHEYGGHSGLALLAVQRVVVRPVLLANAIPERSTSTVSISSRAPGRTGRARGEEVGKVGKERAKPSHGLVAADAKMPRKF